MLFATEVKASEQGPSGYLAYQAGIYLHKKVLGNQTDSLQTLVGLAGRQSMKSVQFNRSSAAEGLGCRTMYAS